MISITFISNFMNHHQLPLSLEFYNNENIEYKFIATKPLPDERANMGYDDMNSKYPFIIKSYESDDEKEKAVKIVNESDIVIFGSAPEIYIKERIKQNKLTFLYSERIFKKEKIRLLHLRIMLYLFRKHTINKNKNVYMLCASAYTAGDYALAGAYINKTYKWGYFPEVKEYDIKELIKNKSKAIKILWVARFLDWKHPEKMIELAKRLKKDNLQFKIEMIGNGKEYEKVENIIKKENLSNEVSLLGAIPYEDVRKKMEEANIFVFTSDKGEGWGAVLNEAMNSGCAVIANDEIGSVPFLIEDRKNGLIVHKNNNNQIYSYVKELISNKELREKYGENAYYTLKDIWNAKVAVNNFLSLLKNIQEGKKQNDIEYGPCSDAKIK